jgi:hypothetical protein
MEILDLNIHNYELNDLLNLFKLPFNFNDSDLKNAKKIVLKTHPDKSGLDKEYFLFFSKAYKYLFKIHSLRESSTTTNTEYDKDELWKNEHNLLIDGKISSMDQSQYNKWFNETFEKMKIKDEYEENGYGEWLKSDDDIVSNKISNSAEMNEFIENKKRQLRSLVVHKDFQDFNSRSGFNLVRETPEDYGSGLFDKLQFEDLKKAHVESVIPVTQEDYHNRKKYSTVDELNRSRTQDSVLNEKEWLSSHEDKLNNLKTTDEDINIRRAYKLLNQDEQAREKYNSFWSDLKRIKH